MAFWLFQTHPNDYLLSASLALLDREPMLITRYADEIRPGDYVFFGMVGGNEGVYAIGEVESEPREFDYPSDIQSFWLNHDIIMEPQTWAWVDYVVKIHQNPIMRPHLLLHAELQDLPVLLGEVGEYNYRLSAEQVRGLVREFPKHMGGNALPAALLRQVGE